MRRSARSRVRGPEPAKRPVGASQSVHRPLASRFVADSACLFRNMRFASVAMPELKSSSTCSSSLSVNSAASDASLLRRSSFCNAIRIVRMRSNGVTAVAAEREVKDGRASSARSGGRGRRGSASCAGLHFGEYGQESLSENSDRCRSSCLSENRECRKGRPAMDRSCLLPP